MDEMRGDALSSGANQDKRAEADGQQGGRVGAVPAAGLAEQGGPSGTSVTECFEFLPQRLSVLNALMAELDEKPLDKVRPADLCARCGISRTSFYRYFSGVRDIAGWYQRYTSELGLHQIGLTLTCAQGHAASLSLIARAYAMYRELSPFWVQDYSLPAIQGQRDAMARVLARRGLPVGAAREYEMTGISCACHETVSLWMQRGMDIPIGRLADILASFYPDGLRKILDDPIDPSDAASVATSRLEGAAVSWARGDR